MNAHVPERAERLAKWSLAPWERQAVLGDLQEEFLNIAETSGIDAATRWYWRHVLWSLWPNVIRRARGDEYRASIIRRTVPSFGQGLMWMTMAALPRHHGERTEWYFGCAAISITGGLISGSRALFRRRVRIPAAGREPMRWVFGLATVAFVIGISVLQFGGQTSVFVSRTWDGAYLFCGYVLLLLITEIIVSRRGRYAPPPEFFVTRMSAPSELLSGWLELDVANAPLAMSSLVLCHLPYALTADGIPANAPTIERTFRRADILRLYAVVNAPTATAAARLDVIASNGDVRLQRPVPIVRGQLEEVVKQWDDVADREPATDFGDIDIQLPLASLAPDRYCLRLTLDDGERTSMQQERIDVRP